MNLQRFRRAHCGSELRFAIFPGFRSRSDTAPTAQPEAPDLMGAVSDRESPQPLTPPSSPKSRVPSPGHQHGFTLIELILVVILIGILSAVATVFILPPFQAAVDIERRANLVDAADSALTRIRREARNALPNSIRVHNPGFVEFISTRTGGRYRRLPAPGGGSDTFVPARSADSFDVLGGLPDTGAVATRGAGTNCANGAGDCVSIFNTGQPGFNAYNQESIAAITAASASTITYDTGGAGRAFATHSPRQRFFVVDDVISYRCENGRMIRYSGYGLQSGTPNLANPELVAENVANCQFTFNPGTATRRGLLTLRIDMARDTEDVFLLTQTQVMNAP